MLRLVAEPEEGRCVITSPDVADDVLVHFSNILGEGYRALARGEPAEFRYEECCHDGFRYSAISVRRPRSHAQLPTRATTVRRERRGSFDTLGASSLRVRWRLTAVGRTQLGRATAGDGT